MSHTHQAVKKDTTLHLNYSKTKNVSKTLKSDMKIVAFSKAAELSSKEGFAAVKRRTEIDRKGKNHA